MNAETAAAARRARQRPSGFWAAGQLGRMLALAAASARPQDPYFCARKPTAPPAMSASADDVRAPMKTRPRSASVRPMLSPSSPMSLKTCPRRTAALLNGLRPVRPGPAILAATQDRLVEKRFLNDLGLPTAPFAPVDDPGSLARAVGQLGRPSILKTRRFGYDGKGQATIREGTDLPAVFRSLGAKPCILEGAVNFEREVSVIAARGIDGSFVAYDVCENHHENHILSRTIVPASISANVAAQAIEMTRRIAEALDYIGVIAVEMFVTREWPAGGGPQAQALRVNEIAPRVHNSGHWTLDGAVTSQFEQHIRAICGWPLGSARRQGAIVMDNLIGEDASRWMDILEEDGACLHLYGKAEIRAGRKMGHMTRIVREG